MDKEQEPEQTPTDQHKEADPAVKSADSHNDRAFPGQLGTMLGFCRRAHNFMLGRETLYRRRHNLHFIWITRDISENSRKEILYKFAPYPIVCYGSSEDVNEALGTKGAKVIGFTKGGLSKSVYECLRKHRINRALHPSGSGGKDLEESAQDEDSTGTPQAKPPARKKPRRPKP
jgi:hypothetical protein